MKMTENQVRTMLRNMRTAIEEDASLQEVFMGTSEAIAVINLIASLTAERNALKAQQENREADIYTAGYDAGEEAAARDIKQLKTQLAAMTAERDALKAQTTWNRGMKT